MKRITPSELTTFLAIANHRSFSRAAVALGVSASALSHAMRGIEERLDLRLFNRTTRSVALTEAGQRLYARIGPAFRDIEEAIDELDVLRGKPSGTLRINAGRAAVQLVLLPVVTRFLHAYPEVRVELAINDGLIDMVSEGFDAGVRFGETIAADMIATALGPRLRSAIVASPAFFELHAKPLHPQDLRRLPCVRLRFPSGVYYTWEFERGGMELKIAVDGPLAIGDMQLTLEAALDGVGLAYVFEGMAQTYLDQGRLVRVLEDWCPYYPGLFLYYPSHRQVPAALKAFVEFARGETNLVG